MKVSIKKFVSGPLATNAYVVHNENLSSCIMVDPSSECDELLSFVSGDCNNPGGILLTHGHFDHLLGIGEIQTKFPELPVWIHPQDRQMLQNSELNGALMIQTRFDYHGDTRDLIEGDMEIGGISFQVLHLPGHSPGGCAFLFENDCICGDAVFAGSIGRTDLPGGNGPALVAAIREKILTLPENVVLYPGHGGRTTVGREKRMNPFLI